VNVWSYRDVERSTLEEHFASLWLYIFDVRLINDGQWLFGDIAFVFSPILCTVQISVIIITLLVEVWSLWVLSCMNRRHTSSTIC